MKGKVEPGLRSDQLTLLPRFFGLVHRLQHPGFLLGGLPRGNFDVVGPDEVRDPIKRQGAEIDLEKGCQRQTLEFGRGELLGLGRIERGRPVPDRDLVHHENDVVPLGDVFEYFLEGRGLQVLLVTHLGRVKNRDDRLGLIRARLLALRGLRANSRHCQQPG